MPRPKGPKTTGSEATILVVLVLSLLMVAYGTYLLAIDVRTTAYALFAGVGFIWVLSFAFTAHTRAQRRRKY